MSLLARASLARVPRVKPSQKSPSRETTARAQQAVSAVGTGAPRVRAVAWGFAFPPRVLALP